MQNGGVYNRARIWSPCEGNYIRHRRVCKIWEMIIFSSFLIVIIGGTAFAVPAPRRGLLARIKYFADKVSHTSIQLEPGKDK
jgi:hypothetical protein